MTQPTIEQVFKADGFEFSTRERAEQHLAREDMLSQVAHMLSAAIDVLDDEERIQDDPHLLMRLQRSRQVVGGTKSLRSTDGKPDPKLLARAMAVNTTSFAAAVDVLRRLKEDLN